MNPVIAILALAPLLGLIITNVAWVNRASSIENALHFPMTRYNYSIMNFSDPRVIFTNNIDVGSVLGNVIWYLDVTEFPDYYVISFNYGGVLTYVSLDTDITIVIANAILDAFTYQTAPDPQNPPVASVAFVQGGYSTLSIALFSANAFSGLYTDLTIYFPFGATSPAPIPGICIFPRTYATWNVPK